MNYALSREYGERALPTVRGCAVANYLAIIMRVARVGGVSVAERNLAIPLAQALQADEPVTRRALQLSDDQLSLQQLAVPLTDPVVRLCLYRDACRMSLADGRLDEGEQGVLEELARALELQVQVARRVAELVRRVWEAEEEFLQLLP